VLWGGSRNLLAAVLYDRHAVLCVHLTRAGLAHIAAQHRNRRCGWRDSTAGGLAAVTNRIGVEAILVIRDHFY